MGSSGVFRSDRISFHFLLVLFILPQLFIIHMSHDLFLLSYCVFTMFLHVLFGLLLLSSLPCYLLDHPLLTCSIVSRCISQRLGRCLERTMENERKYTNVVWIGLDWIRWLHGFWPGLDWIGSDCIKST